MSLNRAKLRLRVRHYGPGPHRTGTPQSVHGRGGMGRWKEAEAKRIAAEQPAPPPKAEPPPPPAPPAVPMTKAEADEWLLRVHDSRLSSIKGHPNSKKIGRLFAELGFDASAVLHLRNAFEFNDTESGLRGQIDRLTVQRLGGATYSITVSGTVNDAAHSFKGSFDRVFTAGGEVHHEYLRLNDSVQGSGFGSRFYQNSEDVYRQMGAKAVTLFADLKVGGYAWARMGFDFRDAATLNQVRGAFVEHLKTSGQPESARLAGNIQHAWEMAAFEGPKGERWGKYFLLGNDHNWNGVKLLSESAEGFQVGRAYFDKKGKGK